MKNSYSEDWQSYSFLFYKVVFLLLLCLTFIQCKHKPTGTKSQDANALYSELFESVEHGDFQQIKIYIQQNPKSLNISDSLGNSLLHLAVNNNEIDIAEYFIEKGIEINATNRQKQTPLHLASWVNLEIAELLLDKGANPNSQNEVSESPIYNAIYMGNTILADLLLKKGAEINIQTNWGDSPLHRAAGNGNIAIVKILLDYHPNLEIKNKYGYTPLHYAAVFGHVEIVRLLVSKGVDFNTLSYDSLSAYQLAIYSKHQEIAKFLEDGGAYTNTSEYITEIGSYFGQTPPGKNPQTFAPGIIFKIVPYGEITITEDGNEIFFSMASQHNLNQKIWTTHRDQNGWTQTQRASFSDFFSEGAPALSGNDKLVFYSNRPYEKSDNMSDLNVWIVHRNSDKWGEPDCYPFNTAGDEVSTSATKSGDIYFHFYNDGKGMDISVSHFQDGNYLSPIPIDSSINSRYNEVCPFIAQDGSYIIFSSDRPGGHHFSNELYISFVKPDGTWSSPKNMGQEINRHKCMSSYVSPDSKYLFFTSLRNGFYQTYWVSANIIHELKKEI